MHTSESVDSESLTFKIRTLVLITQGNNANTLVGIPANREDHHIPILLWF